MAATTEQLASIDELEQLRGDYLQALLEISVAIDEQQQNIVDARAAILSDQAQLAALGDTDEDAARREELAANIVYNESVVAANISSLETNEARLSETQDLINQTSTELASVELAIEGPGPVPTAVPGNQTGYPPVAYDDDGNLLPGYELDEDNNPVFVGYDSISGPAPVPPSQTGYSGVAYDDDGNLLPGWTLDENNNPVYVGGDFVEPATAASAAASRTQALKLGAQQQNTLQNRVSLPSSADWRVRLSLAQNATYLYRDTQNAGIMAPLARTNGVIFPYTPNIETSYQAKYDSVDLTHSNYRGYFYRNSSVEALNIRGMFTAQDTKEAEYLLAVITFFRSVTKMFYGATDKLAGTPPPLVFLSGLGQYQFNNHPCVVASFTYNLPSDVDYIRANGFNNYGVNLDNRRQQSSGPPTSGILGAIATVNRLFNNGLSSGATNKQVSPSAVGANNSNTNYTNSTYVPTKMEISIQLLPIQTRSQVSTQFNVQDFASGKLLQQGFW